MKYAINAKELTKYYGEFLAVDNISFTVDHGEVFGFLGPNGAGKSTTIRMLTGISLPSSGTAEIMGYDITKNPVSAQAQMGIVPDISNIYTSLTAWQNLDFTGKLYGIPKIQREKRNNELLERFELFDRKDEKVEGYSRGMRRKICIAMALMNESKILYLDEPTSGLDVKSVRGIRNLIRGLNKEGLTIFLTTHNLDEANKMCDRIAVINRGRIAATGSPENLRGAIERSQSIEISFEKNPNNYDTIRDLSEVIDVQKRGDKIRIVTSNPKETLNDLFTFVSNANLSIVSINTMGPSLEEAFLEITGREMKKEIMKKRRRGK